MARPQKLPDSEILAVIASLRAARRASTGVDVRRELFRRFGIRTGTNRLYRLLRQAQTEASLSLAAPTSSQDLGQVTLERDAAVRRAQLAEFREQASQEHSAKQIDELRQRLRAMGVDPFSSDLGPRRRSFPV